MRHTRHRKRVNIGIVSAPMPLKHLNQAQSYLDKAYVSWVQLSGANAVVIPYNTTELAAYMSSVHGIVWVGGGIENTKTHSPKQYRELLHVFRRIYEYAVRENDKGHYFPLWGTCLGFDILAMMPEHVDHDCFKRIQHAHKFRLAPLVFTGPSRLRRAVPLNLQRDLASAPCVRHVHEYGFDITSEHTRKLTRYLKIVSVDEADDGTKFMNMFEFKNYPFYGSQWHPEKPLTDLGVDLAYTLSLFLKKECAHNKTVPPRWSKIFEPLPLDSPFTVLLRGGTTV